MRAASRALVLLAIGFAVGFTTMTASRSSASASTTIEIHYSHFTQGLVTARVGVPLTISLRNEDPIDHEWIVGTEAVHERHRTGTEPYHDQIPTEVTIPALSTRTTTVVFNEPGDYSFICHLPGHEAYGMHGILRVLAN